MQELHLIIGSLLSIVVSLVIIPFLPSPKKSVAAFLLVALNAILTSAPAIHALLSNTTIQYSFFLAYPVENIPVRIDSLTAWFILIINLTCLNGGLYGIGYMKPYEAQKNNISLHWILFVIFQVSMVWVCMLQNGLAFLIAWEIMSISSLLLLMFEHSKPETLKAGMNYLVQMHIGVVMLTIGFIWIYLAEGSFDFSAIDRFFNRNSSLWPFFIFFIGFGIKAGFIPLHTWLPHAHPAAPSHVSGVDTTTIFPSTRSYQSHYIEFFERRIIDRLNNQLIGFMNYFTFIHNGQTQRYVLYGLFFIIVLIAATFLNLL